MRHISERCEKFWRKRKITAIDFQTRDVIWNSSVRSAWYRKYKWILSESFLTICCEFKKGMSRMPAGYLRKSHSPRSCSLKVVEARLREWQELAGRHLTEFSALLIDKQNQEIALPLATDLKSLVASLSGCELSEIFGRAGNWLNGEFPRENEGENPIPCHVRRIWKMTVIRENSWRFWSSR